MHQGAVDWRLPTPSPASKPCLPLRQARCLNETIPTCRSIRRQKLKKRVDTVASPAYITATSPDGGIGRRARFRSVCREAWRFESSSGHQFPVSGSHMLSRNIQEARFAGLFCCPDFRVVPHRAAAVGPVSRPEPLLCKILAAQALVARVLTISTAGTLGHRPNGQLPAGPWSMIISGCANILAQPC